MSDAMMSPSVKSIPPEIAKAIVEVMSGVRKLARGDKNQHGGYNFASIDAFLEALNPLCAEAGLFFFMDEVETEVIPRGEPYKDQYGKTKESPASLRVRYHITICHASGAVCGPVCRTVTVIASGAQAYGSAQSYALKQFMRSLFQIPTGDADDADHHSPGELAPQPSMPKQASRALYAELQADIDAADSVDALTVWKARRKADILSMPRDWVDEIGQRYADKMLSFAPKSELTYDQQ